MKGIKNKQNSKWKRLSLFLVLLLVFGVLLNSVGKVYKKKEEAEKALTRMENEAEELKKRGEFLEKSLERLTTDEGLQFEIRRKFNVAGAGEKVAVIIEEEQTPSVQSSRISFWQKTKTFFKWLFE